MNTLIDAALTWRAQDPDADTVARLDELIAGSESGDSSAQAGRPELQRSCERGGELGTCGLVARLVRGDQLVGSCHRVGVGVLGAPGQGGGDQQIHVIPRQ